MATLPEGINLTALYILAYIDSFLLVRMYGHDVSETLTVFFTDIRREIQSDTFSRSQSPDPSVLDISLPDYLAAIAEERSRSFSTSEYNHGVTDSDRVQRRGELPQKHFQEIRQNLLLPQGSYGRPTGIR